MYISEGVAAFVAGSKLPNAYAEKAFSTINFRPLTFDSPSKGQCMYGYVFRAKLGMDLESGYEFVLLKSLFPTFFRQKTTVQKHGMPFLLQ